QRLSATWASSMRRQRRTRLTLTGRATSGVSSACLGSSLVRHGLVGGRPMKSPASSTVARPLSRGTCCAAGRPRCWSSWARPGSLARLVESVVSGLESRGIIDPETARGLRELTDNLLGIISGLYDRAKELWDQLGQVDLGEYLDQARRFRDELEALGDVAEQERLAILARIERLDELVEIERLVAQVTGQAFDETRFRAQELSRAITQVARQMFEAGESVETITETIAPLVEQLEP